ncbi:MAG: PKD domain-containing protein [Bacteroidota bacterium]
MKKYLIFYFLFLISVSGAIGQCLTYPVPFTQRINDASAIVEGKIVSQQSFWNAGHDFIYTSFQVEVYKVFKGGINASTIELINEGGEVGNTKIVAEPNLVLNELEVGIFFLTTPDVLNTASQVSTNLQFKGTSSQQSFVKYDLVTHAAADLYNTYPDIQADLYDVIQQQSGANYLQISSFAFPQTGGGGNHILVFPAVTGIAPGVTTAGTFSTITISGTNFGPAYAGTTNLEFPDANNGGAGYISTPANHIISWNATTIQARVPTGAGSGFIRVTNNLGEATVSGINLTINYNESNVNSGGIYYQPDLINKNGAGGYTFVYNNLFNTNGPAVAAFERALQTWRCATYVNFTRAGTTAIACQALDGINVSTFDGSCALPAGVLGTSYSYYSGCSGGVWYLNENDCKWRTNGTAGIFWQYGPALCSGAPAGDYDFESVCVHELGHSHQLGHTILPVTVMNYAISNDIERRGLTPASEVAGGTDIMTRSVVANACGPAPMIALTPANCTLNAPTADFIGNPLSGCAPLTVNFTDASLNTPTSWSWTFTGGAPAASGAQNPSVVYATPGVYSVTLVATNASGSDTRTKTNYITVTNCTPVSNFTGNPTTLCEGQTVSFFDASTNTPTSWTWTFPGGTPAASASQNPVVSYATAGVYNVTLQVTNAYGTNTLTKTNYITVNACPPPPVSNFTGTPTTVCVGSNVTFSDLSTGGPTSWQWTFAGGTPGTSLAQNPVVTYSSTGVYSVTLQVTNSSGTSTFTRTNYITVNACSAPTANFAGAPTTICEGQTVNFFDLSTGGPSSWSWTFTGGAPGASGAQNPVVTYAVAGTYTVSLTASNAFGGNNKTVAAYITVQVCPSAGSGLIVNDGSLIFLQPGALIFDEGGFINQDNGANIGNIDNFGTFELKGDWTNNSTSNCFINSSPGVTVLSGAAQGILGSTPTYYFNLTLSGTGVKSQAVDARTEGTLALNDRELATNDYVMYVTNTAAGAITRTGGFSATPVQGFVSSTNNGKLWRNTNSTASYVYPVGSTIGSPRFRPVEIKPTSAAASTFGIRFVNNDPNTQGYNRALKDPSLGTINPLWYQRVTRISGTAITDIKLYYDNIADGVASFATNLMTEWGPYSPPVQWNDLGLVSNTGAASPALSSVTKGGWNVFNTENFNISPQSQPLPVELIKFTAVCDKANVILEWTTASEINNDYFTVEKSLDTKNFEEIATIDGNGTSSEQHNYEAKDQAENGSVYYRLKQTDFDGKTTYSDDITVNCDRSGRHEIIGIYPNPAHSIIAVDLFLAEGGDIKMTLYNAIGQLVIEKEMSFKNGFQKFTIDLSELPPDVYQLNLTTGLSVTTKKVVKM